MPERTTVPEGGPPGKRSGRRWWIVPLLAAVAVVIGASLLVTTRTTDSADDPPPGTSPRFVDVTDESGIAHVYDGEFDFFVGGGVSAFDCDGDGRPELYLAGGALPAALYRNRTDAGGPLRFEREESPATDLTAVTGAYPLDADSDGLVDLMVLRHGENLLLRGLGDCRFEAANDDLGLDGGDEWTTAFSATWESGASLPTLAIGNYLAHGSRAECADSALLRPRGETYGAPVPLAPGHCTLSVLFSDWNRTGRHDLRMTNDRHYYREGSEQLWEVGGARAVRQYTLEDGWRPLQIWGMGIASQDVTYDGLPEVFLTSQGDNKLQTLADDPSRPTYRDIALRAGVTAQRPHTGGDVLPSTAWHPEFDDVNNDGALDLFVTKGNVEAQPDHADRDPNNLLIAQPDGTFVESAEEAGITDFERSRGAAVVDLDLDGLLDLVVVNRRTAVTVWHNVGRGSAEEPIPMGHWLAVRLAQPGTNRDAVGAWIEARLGDRIVSREVTVGGGHGGGQLGWMHFGLGENDRAEIRVQWPDGEIGPWMELDAGQRVTIDRLAAEPVPWPDDA